MNASAPTYYESDQAVREYLLFHFGEPAEIMPWPFGPLSAVNFPARCVSECLEPELLPPQASALDLGCAVGRSSFELARHCTRVLGLDASEAFVRTARELKRSGAIDYPMHEEGGRFRQVRAVVPPEIDREHVTFGVADAHALPAGTGAFHVVLLANLVDRLSHPRRCLAQMDRLVVPGGQLIITSPYTWMAEYTAPARWLGHEQEKASPGNTFEALRELLSPAFELRARRDLPFVIREHRRKFQWSVAEATTWVRKPVKEP